MDVRIGSEEPMGRNPQKSKLRRPNGPPVPSPAAVADQAGRGLIEREPEWLERLVSDPASFATIEREVHAHARRQADLYVAGLRPKRASARKRRATWTRWSLRPRSRSVRLKKN